MERFAPLLLEVWREVGRHFEIAESVERIAPLIARRAPVEAALVRRPDAEGGHVETIAAATGRGAPLPGPSRTEATAERLDALARWGRGGEPLRLPAEAARRKLPGLVPEGLDGPLLAVPLRGDGRDEPIGFLLLLGRPPRDFRAEHEDLLRALAEPLAVALENDRRIREVNALREAVEADNRSLLRKLGRSDLRDEIVGAETGLRVVMEQVDLVAPSDAPVLVLGETGSGKEVVARAIHTRSKRAAGPFLRVNCGAIPPELIDSELFGHERGSFTGAVGERKGWFERADGGTLFLDEVGELPPAAQVRLLRILQDGTFERVGGERPQHVDVRIVAATHRDLEAMVAEGRFRQDLWYRIAVFPLRLPSLRERPADVAPLAAHFALRAARRLGMPPVTPTPGDLALLAAYPWPGNVRELAAVIERAAILGGGRGLDVARALGAVPPAPPAAPAPASSAPPETLDEAMRRHIAAALEYAGGRVEGPRGAAALLGINPHTLRSRMRKLGLDWSRLRAALPKDFGLPAGAPGR